MKITPLVRKRVEEEREVRTQPEEEEELKRQPEEEEEIQREVEDEEEEPMQAKVGSSNIPEVTSSVEGRINSLKGGGSPMPESLRAYFEPRFGYDFGNVRLHRDSNAAETARAVNAQAFTFGNNIVFGSGRYAPETGTGKKLLAHELTHVVQQNQKENNKNIYQTPSQEKILSKGLIQRAPASPTTKPRFVCGPDVTDQVKQAVANVKKDYSALSTKKRKDVCGALTSYSSGLYAWDIVELHNNAWIYKNYRPDCATKGGVPKRCGSSVQVGKECYYAGSPNYVIFGVMFKLCKYSKSNMTGLIKLYKPNAGNLNESIKWAEAGYDGWPSGGSPPAGDRANCKPVCPKPYKGTKFKVRWCPHIDPYGQCGGR